MALCISSLDGHQVYVDPKDEHYPFFWNDLRVQAAYTAVSMCTTLLSAVIGGLITGWIMVLFPFPIHEFNDIDNFRVFDREYGHYDVLNDDDDDEEDDEQKYDPKYDSFRDTIRGPHFGEKFRWKWIRNRNGQRVHGVNRQNTAMIMEGDYGWGLRTEFDDEDVMGYRPTVHRGIQVVDSTVHLPIDDLEAMEWRQCVENGIMPNSKSISITKMLRDYYFDENEDHKQMEHGDALYDDEEAFYPSFCTAKVRNRKFEDFEDEKSEEKRSEQLDDGTKCDEFKYYLTVKLKSNVNVDRFERKHLNLVVVLDLGQTRNREMAEMMATMIRKQLRSTTDRRRFASEHILQSLDLVGNINVDALQQNIVSMRNSHRHHHSESVPLLFGHFQRDFSFLPFSESVTVNSLCSFFSFSNMSSVVVCGQDIDRQCDRRPHFKEEFLCFVVVGLSTMKSTKIESCSLRRD